MRTRFINVDYFAPSSSPGETISFLNLPVPHLPPSRPHSFEEELLRFGVVANVPLEIERLPIDDALGKFISEVIPRNVEFECGSDRGGDRRVFSPEGDEFRFLQKDYETAAADGTKHISDFIHFEEPDPNVFTETGSYSEQWDKIRILTEVSEIETLQDLLEPALKLYSNKLQESIHSVEHINLPYDVVQRSGRLEDDGSVQEQMQHHHETLPLLEVDETSLRTFSDSSMEDQLCLFLEKTTQKDNFLIDGIEVLDSMQCDIIGFLSNHLLSEQCPESQLAFLVVDIVNMVETLWDTEDATGCDLPRNPLVFEEFEFHDADMSQSYEVFFEKQTRYEPVTCHWIFSEDMKIKNFNELIVSGELAMMDDTFRSLPIPVLSDDNKMRSMSIIVEEILSELKLQNLTASDELYLDWHLLEEDNYNCETFFDQSMLRELHSHSSDFDHESLDDGKLVFDFILSDDALYKPKMEEHKELLDVFYEDTSQVPPRCVALSKLLDGNQKLVNGRQITEENAGRASLLLNSVSQFNDLDFFLNPGKVVAGLKSGIAVKAPDTGATFSKEGDSNSISAPNENMSDYKFEELMNFAPVEDSDGMMSSESGDKAETFSMPMPVPDMPDVMQSEQIQGHIESFPETIIVVNTQNFDTEMIVSRRSTYQRILAMEKKGAQVLERDIDLPTDVIINCRTCLVWYDCKNIGKKSTTGYEASSCLPLCIENIASNVLTLLSFSFSGCILIFEGEVNFLSTVMESSDGLYAAAASLGMDFHLFCSYSCDLTDEIILSSILSVNKMSRRIYPRILESETLAESFLTKFPSVNPLTAHAIMSSGGSFLGFLGRSHEQRILAIQQYQVPVEIVALFSALCRYGEREDSKSIMTDCSSSVSSGPDSEKSHFNVDSERKRGKRIRSPPANIDEQVNGIWKSEHVNQFADGVEGPSGVSKQHDYWISPDSEILDEFKWPSSSLKFGQKTSADDASLMNPSNISKPYDFWEPKSSLALDEIKEPMVSLDGKLFCQNGGSEVNMKGKLDRSNTPRNSKNLHADFVGEVIDLTDSSRSAKHVSAAANSVYFEQWLPEMDEGSSRKSKTVRRLSFGKNYQSDFPAADEINSEFDFWPSVKDYKESLQENNHFDSDVSYSKVALQHQKELSENGSRQSAGISKEFPFKEEISYCGGTPLSKAICSSRPQPGSPWTMEFLNRIREKSRFHQQSIPCDTPSPNFGYKGNISRVAKRRSPSIIELFKYHGGSTPGKLQEQRKLKPSMQLPNSPKNKNDSASTLSTCTPTDKRSRQTLSFAVNGSGSQTRLVWSDGKAQHRNKKFRNQ